MKGARPARLVPLPGRAWAAALSLALLRAGPALAADRAPGTLPPGDLAVADAVYRGKLDPGWRDDGWVPRITGEGPARLDFSGNGGWMLSRPGLTGHFGGVSFRFKAPPRFGEFLEVRLDADGADFPKVEVRPEDRLDLADGWSEVWIAMSRLNPQGAAFDSLLIHAAKGVESEPVLVDEVVLTQNAPPPPAPPAAAAPAVAAVAAAAAPAAKPAKPAPERKAAAKAQAAAQPASPPLVAAVAPAPARSYGPLVPARVAIDCAGPTHKISPYIYGIALDERHEGSDAHQFDLGATARRWGGNSATRFNWKLGHAWNSAVDWYFENLNYTDDPNYSWTKFLEANRSRDLRTALTVPIMGWVAKDTSSYSFPVSSYGPQQSVDPFKPDAGNGVGADGHQLTANTSATSTAVTPADVEQWVRTVRQADQKRGGRSVWMYILDNEPMLWSSTHRDVHPEPTSYDELLDKTLLFAAAVRRADPEAVIAGPALWGWPAYQGSAVDAKYGFTLRPDRRAHGDVPLLPWYLHKLAQHEKKTGQRLIDVVDVHFYAMGQGIETGLRGETDADTAARRIRATRALWDSTYVDESWIKTAVRLIPRVKDWIAKEYPGLGLSIGEWSFGAEKHPSGGLATAEALGRFGEQDITAAFYWTYPAKDSPAFWAFRAFRNFDGEGGHFEDWSLKTRAPAPLSAFASRNEGGSHLTVVLLNLDPTQALDAGLDLSGCAAVSRHRTFQYSPDSRLAELADGSSGADAPHPVLPPWSITVVDLTLDPSRSQK